MGQSVRTGHDSQKRYRVAGTLTVVLFLPLAALGFSAQATDAGSTIRAAHASSTSSAPAAASAKLSRITIEASQKLRHRVDRFVATVVAPAPSHESLLRWNKPICPLVVGLPRERGEFILARISQAARDARAPLAGRHCQPNLFVVVTPQPDQVLEEWMARHPQVDTRHGMAPLDHFLKSARPVRVWYNSQPGCAGGASRSGSAAELNSVMEPSAGVGKYTGASPGTGMGGPVYCDDSIDTHLTYGDVRSIGYAIVVADLKQLHRQRVTIGQLADYVSLVGLVDIRSDTDGGGMPTILRLFRDPNPPPGLTRWDRALLYSLYNTSQTGQLQLTDMEVTMVRRIAP